MNTYFIYFCRSNKMPTKTHIPVALPVPSLVPVLVPFATSVRVALCRQFWLGSTIHKVGWSKCRSSANIHICIYVSLLNNKCLVWLLFIFVSFCFVGFSGLQRRKRAGGHSSTWLFSQIVSKQVSENTRICMTWHEVRVSLNGEYE